MRNESATIGSRSSGRLPWISVFVAAGILVVALAGSLYRHYSGKAAEQLVREGRTAFSRGEFSRAVDCAERAIGFSPQSAPAWKLLAEAAGLEGRVDRALEGLAAYSKKRPDDACQLGVKLASFWMKQNLVRPSLKALQLSEQLNVDSLDALQLQEQIAAVTGHPRETVRCIIELLKRGAFTRGDMLIVTAMTPGLDDAERLEAILQADPANKSPWLAKALGEMNQNHMDAAEQLLLEITATHPEELEAHGLLGELYAMFLPEKFLRWHDRLPPQMEDDARVWSARGKWLSHAGQTAAAVRCLHEALLREPEQLATTALLGRLLKSLNETALGNAFTERGRRLQRITDLNGRLNELRADEFILPMIEELEATGRLWEAWGWCVIHEQAQAQRHPAIIACKDRLEPQLSLELPRTLPGSLPGGDFAWERFPLPDWSQLESSALGAAGKGLRSPVHFEDAGGSKPLPVAPLNRHSTIRFEDQSEQAGLDFRFVNTYAPESGRKIFETMGAGVAVLDYDQDGWPDLYFPQGKPLPLDNADGPSDALYRNQSGERYLPVTQTAGIHETTYSQGVAAGDYDNDGFPDLYVANLGRNRLFRNNGDGTFSDATDEAGLQQTVWTVSCAIADLNGDGLPELFDVNYVQAKDLLTRTCLDAHGRPFVCRPTVFDPVLDTVALNLGDGRFQEQQSEAGLDLPQGMGLGLVIADYNDDHRLDVFVANDMTANYLLINEQAGPGQPLRFRDEAFLRGAALDEHGLAQACMGVACADINRDRQPDLFVTNFSRESNTLYLSQPGELYQDTTQQAGLRAPSFDLLGFGTQFLDADRDGWFDLVVANGHIDEFVNEPYRMKAQMFRGLPDGRFTELTAQQAGPLFEELRLARGLALLDWNRDGRTDFVATDLERPVLLAVNQTESPHQSLHLKLAGTQSSRDAIGAKVRVQVAPDDERVFQLTAGDGYESSNERVIEIAAGTRNRLSQVEIAWPSGQVSRFEDVLCEGDWLVIEGRAEWIPRGVE